ncbi:MAG: cytochrome c [Bacteriovoracaceae bacterium]
MFAKLSKLLLPLLLLPMLGGAFINNTVRIESLESKTHQGHPVYNQITLKSEKFKDTWLMRQSHHGANYPLDKWDEIAIVINKKTSPATVSYHQYQNGKEIEFKASCYTCHANGPRVIRPNYNSGFINYNWQDKLSINWMNLKIKLYGKVQIDKNNFKLKQNFRRIPLKYFGERDTEVLNIQTCNYCHKESGFHSRGNLQRQHVETIKHLTKTGSMPPWPFNLSSKEKKELERFIQGH